MSSIIYKLVLERGVASGELTESSRAVSLGGRNERVWCGRERQGHNTTIERAYRQNGYISDSVHISSSCISNSSVNCSSRSGSSSCHCSRGNMEGKMLTI